MWGGGGGGAGGGGGWLGCGYTHAAKKNKKKKQKTRKELCPLCPPIQKRAEGILSGRDIVRIPEVQAEINKITYFLYK